MKRILIITDEIEADAIDFASTMPAAEIYRKWDESKKKRLINTGNKIWMQGLVASLSPSDNVIEYFNSSMRSEEINATFDLAILSTANLFSSTAAKRIQRLTNLIAQLKIPVYIISVGIQAETEFDLFSIKDSIGTEASELVSAIYDSGGEIGVRGHYTKQFLDSVCSNHAEIIGCPSLFQLGPNLSIPTDHTACSDFRYILNGDMFFDDYAIDPFKMKGVFIDQSLYGDLLFEDTEQKHLTKLSIPLALLKMHELFKENNQEHVFQLYASRRIKYFMSPNVWFNYLKNNGFVFSFGSRIHGNIISILAGIPALIRVKDLRVRELAQYFNIPTIECPKIQSEEELYDYYKSTDYTTFNLNYPIIYEKYQRFLRDHNICTGTFTKPLFSNLTPDEINSFTSSGDEGIQLRAHRLFAIYQHIRSFRHRT